LPFKEVVFGVHVPPEGHDFQEMKSICLMVEGLGFDLFTITDHFMNMAQPDGPNHHPLECWSTLAGLAAVTSKIRLGPLVSCYYYRPPTVLAKMATTIDIISNGRLVFGIGAGWHQKEFEGFIGRFPPAKERMTGLEETIQIIGSMFRKERTSFRGRIYNVENVLNSPLPVQRPPPIMVGGGGEKKTLRIAAKYADISHCAFNPSEEVLDHKLSVLKEHCKVVNRDFAEIKKGISVVPFIGLKEEDVEAKIRQRAQQAGMTLDEYQKRLGPVKGTPEQCIEAMRKYIDKGVSLFTIVFPYLEDAKLFAEEIMWKLK
jgi:F420-dependent oxidoreductase-like protein